MARKGAVGLEDTAKQHIRHRATCIDCDALKMLENSMIGSNALQEDRHCDVLTSRESPFATSIEVAVFGRRAAGLDGL